MQKEAGKQQLYGIKQFGRRFKGNLAIPKKVGK